MDVSDEFILFWYPLSDRGQAIKRKRIEAATERRAYLNKLQEPMDELRRQEHVEQENELKWGMGAEMDDHEPDTTSGI